MKTSFKILCTLIYYVLQSTFAYSQPGLFQVSTNVNENNTVDIIYRKSIEGSVYFNLFFDKLENCTSISTFYKGNCTSNSGKLITLNPLDRTRPVTCSFRFSWIRGKLVSNIDTSFVYLMPVSGGKTVNVENNFYLMKAYFGQVEPKNWKSLQFNADPGDTVFSVRKGVVVEVNDGFEPDTALLVSFSSQTNSLLVEHQDGTMARYSVLEKGSFMVRPGQVVYPHAPLALAGTFDKTENTQFRLSLYYLIEEKIDNPLETKQGNKKNYYAFVNPLFHTTNGDLRLEAFSKHTSEITPELITKELVKK